MDIECVILVVLEKVVILRKAVSGTKRKVVVRKFKKGKAAGKD